MALAADSLPIARVDCEADGLSLMANALPLPIRKLVLRLLLLVALKVPGEIKLFSLADQRLLDKSEGLSATAARIRSATLGDGSLMRDGIPVRNGGDETSAVPHDFALPPQLLFASQVLRTGMADGSSLVKVFCRCRIGNLLDGVSLTPPEPVNQIIKSKSS